MQDCHKALIEDTLQSSERQCQFGREQHQSESRSQVRDTTSQEPGMNMGVGPLLQYVEVVFGYALTHGDAVK